jgi:hypothetical protein
MEGQEILEEQIGLSHLLSVLLYNLLVLLQLLLCPCPLFLSIFNFLLEVIKFTLNSYRRFSCKLFLKLTFI